MQTSIYNRVYVRIATLGQGTVTIGAILNNLYMTPAEAGALQGEHPFYVLEEGTDFELGIGTFGVAAATMARTEVLKSRIGGVLGTSKLTLAGNARLRLVDPAEAHYALKQTFVTSGASYSMAPNDEHILVNKATGSATQIDLVSVVGRRKPVKIVDYKLDADTNNITIVPDGAETILGLSSWLINTMGGSVELWPEEGEGRWYI